MNAEGLYNLLVQLEGEHPDLSCYTCFIMAKRDAGNGNYAGALSRLRVDWDKFRCYESVQTNLESLVYGTR